MTDDTDRYQVVTTSGWAIPNGRYGHSYTIIDTLLCGREIRTYPPALGARGDLDRKRAARALCERLNNVERLVG